MNPDQRMIEEMRRSIVPLDGAAWSAAEERQRTLVKPLGSLGELETIAIRVAGMTGRVMNRLEKKIHFLFGADNGVYEEGVSGSPQALTGMLMSLYAQGKGCGIDMLCLHTGVKLRLYDLGIRGLREIPGVDASCKLMPEGTDNFVKGRAMPFQTTQAAVAFGIRLAREAARDGYQMIGMGEVGMGNTTTATACIMAALGIRGESLAGRGAGLTDEALEKKRQVIARGLELHREALEDRDPLEILSCVGGLDIAAMTGVYLGSAAARVPVIIDGVISIAAAVLAARLAPDAKEYMIASHCSTEPAYRAAADALGVKPLLNLGMRLGEGTGCPLAMQIVDDALYLMEHMAAFEEVGIPADYRDELKMI